MKTQTLGVVVGFGYILSVMSMPTSPGKLTSSFLGTNASQQNCKKSKGVPHGHGYGKNKCPCVGIDNIPGFFATQIAYHHVQYPLGVGASCSTWDKDYHPECKATPPPAWCLQAWCYVDPCECDLDVLPKKTLTGRHYQGQSAYWSYNTCGALDIFTATVAPAGCPTHKDYNTCVNDKECGWDGKQCGGKDAMATCSKNQQLDTFTHGKQDCRCVGFHGHKNGQAVLYINDHETAIYNSNVGATCGAWEANTHPDCIKDGPKPKFCAERWCFVDPCKCSSGIPPRAMMEANSALRFQGKTVYWSYDTCGSVDEWSGSMKTEYCVTQTTESGCKSMEKCTWTGTQCMGKAFAELCVEQRATGILSVEPVNSGNLFMKPLAAFVMMIGALAA